MTQKNKPIFLSTDIEHKLSEYHYVPSDTVQQIFTEWLKVSEKNLNETQLQSEFLNAILGDVLGYDYSRTGSEYNLEKEVKTDLDGQKPDGILGFFNDTHQDVRVIIELKDSSTDLDIKQYRHKDNRTPIDQAFGYVAKYQSKQSANQGSIEWVIVSNFKEIRLYKPNYQGAYHVFTLDELAKNTQKQKEFHFLCAKDRLFTHNPKKSPTHALNPAVKGDDIEKEFYNQYKGLREQIWYDLIALNHDKHYGRNFYLYKAQKLIDRIIFIRFCRENGAIDFDIVGLAINETLLVKGKYNRLKYLFSSMDLGNDDIILSQFNGGLFAPDDDLDCLTISDAVIDKIYNLYCYNFGSDLDVNILGHIFEQSISDLENLTGDNQKKRKKDGVFYTPPYVTEYIIVQTIDAWVSDKTADIKHDKTTPDYWTAYADILKTIKILDPACGSGAFLVKVFDVLQKKWRDIKAHIQTDYSYLDILKNNIFGVDLNPSSVDITKLSLWLKTAHHRKPLMTLDNNIKIGNSLIDNPDLAGYYSEFEGKVMQQVIQQQLFADKINNIMTPEELEKLIERGVQKSLAIKWKQEFKSVFDAGGFDIIVGNPPYVKEYENRQAFTALKNTPYYEGKMDLWQFFACQGLDMLKNGGYLSFIAPNNWVTNHGATKIRNKILTCANFLKYVDFSDNKIFEDADIQTMILIVKKQEKTAIHTVDYYKMPLVTCKTFKEKQINIADSLKNIAYKSVPIKTKQYIDKTFHFNLSDTVDILSNIEKTGTYKLKDADVANGIHHHHADVNKERLKILGDKFKLGDGIFTLSNIEKLKLNLTDAEKELLKPEYTTKQLERYYGNPHNTHWVIYTDSRFNKPDSMDKYPNLKKHLDKFQSVITSDNAPYGLNRARDENFFKGEKIFSLRKCVGRPKFTFTDFDAYVSAAFYVIKPQDINLKYLTGILNSTLVAFYLKHRGKMQGSNYQIDKAPLLNIPIAIADLEMQNKLIDAVTKLQDAKLLYHTTNTEFLEFLQLDFSLKKISKKLTDWYELTLQDFYDEVKSQAKDISSKQFKKLHTEFSEKQEILIPLKSQIPVLDAQIDQIVYAIYGLTDTDIAVIEGE